MKLLGFPVILCSPTPNLLNCFNFDISLILACSFDQSKGPWQHPNFKTVTSGTFSSPITLCMSHCSLAHSSCCRVMRAYRWESHGGWGSPSVWTEMSRWPPQSLKRDWAESESLRLNILPWDHSEGIGHVCNHSVSTISKRTSLHHTVWQQLFSDWSISGKCSLQFCVQSDSPLS